LHRIFQLHHIPPDEVYAKEWRHRKVMYASEMLAIEAEEKLTKKGGGTVGV
jgi:phosphoribosyl 1,2-cyclic phosphodiesterase